MSYTSKTKTTSHKKRRMIALKGWRRNISGKEKLQAKFLRNRMERSIWDEMIGSIKIKGKKTVRISENVDEIYYR